MAHKCKECISFPGNCEVSGSIPCIALDDDTDVDLQCDKWTKFEGATIKVDGPTMADKTTLDAEFDFFTEPAPASGVAPEAEPANELTVAKAPETEAEASTAKAKGKPGRKPKNRTTEPDTNLPPAPPATGLEVKEEVKTEPETKIPALTSESIAKSQERLSLSMQDTPEFPLATNEMLSDALFKLIWESINTWTISIPNGPTEVKAMGNHAALIYKPIKEYVDKIVALNAVTGGIVKAADKATPVANKAVIADLAKTVYNMGEDLQSLLTVLLHNIERNV